MTRSNFISNWRTQMQAFLSAWDNLRALDRQYQTLGLGSQFVAGDFAGANADLAPADITSCVGDWETVDGQMTSAFDWAVFEKMRS